MFGINPFELMIILMVGLIVVGPKRLPEIGRTVGRAFNELRRVQEEIRDTVRFDLDDDDPEPPSFPTHRQRVPDEPPGPTAVELASAAARDRADAEEPPVDDVPGPRAAPEERREARREAPPEAGGDADLMVDPDLDPLPDREPDPEATAHPDAPRAARVPTADDVEASPGDTAGQGDDAPAPGSNGSAKRPARDEAG